MRALKIAESRALWVLIPCEFGVSGGQKGPFSMGAGVRDRFDLTYRRELLSRPALFYERAIPICRFFCS